MCLANVTEYTACGHFERRPEMCAEKARIRETPCEYWKQREYFQALDTFCRSCKRVVVPSRTASVSSSVPQWAVEEPPHIRRGSLADRYNPTPPPEPESEPEPKHDVEGAECGDGEEEGSRRETDSRISQWLSGVYQTGGYNGSIHPSCELDEGRGNAHQRIQSDSIALRDDRSRPPLQSNDSWSSGLSLPQRITAIEITRRVRVYRSDSQDSQNNGTGDVCFSGTEIVKIWTRPMYSKPSRRVCE